MIIGIVSDLIFRSKLRETLAGQDLHFVKSQEVLERLLTAPGEKEVYVDLHIAGMDPVSAIRSCAGESSVSSVVAYASHVERELMERASSAGASSVMPRSAFITWIQERSSQRGASSLTILVFSAIVFGVLFYLYNVVPFFYDFYELENQMQAAIKLGMNETDASIQKKVLRTMKELKIPADPGDLIFRREKNHIEMRLEYREVFYVTFRDKDYILQTFDFEAKASGNY